jgi:hypothetical protein
MAVGGLVGGQIFTFDFSQTSMLLWPGVNEKSKVKI